MPAHAPSTQTQLSHAMTIMFDHQVIGSINEWNPKQSRGVSELYEFGQTTPGYYPPYSVGPGAPGEPYEKVPNNITGQTIEVRRYDIYTLQMERVLGTSDLETLANQDNPFDVHEAWIVPGGSSAQPYRTIYGGCWFSDVGRTIDAKGDRMINVSATLEYTRRRRG